MNALPPWVSLSFSFHRSSGYIHDDSRIHKRRIRSSRSSLFQAHLFWLWCNYERICESNDMYNVYIKHSRSYTYAFVCVWVCVCSFLCHSLCDVICLAILFFSFLRYTSSFLCYEMRDLGLLPRNSHFHFSFIHYWKVDCVFSLFTFNNILDDANFDRRAEWLAQVNEKKGK